MFASSIDTARVLLGCIGALFAVNFVSNLVLTYIGYDPRQCVKGWVLRKRWSFGFAVLFWFLFVCANIYVEKSVDYDPPPIGRDNIVGIWQKDGKSFRLNNDGTLAWPGKFVRDADKVRWALDDLNHLIEIRGETDDLLKTWRLITVKGEYRIIEDYPTSIDGTGLNSGFKKVKDSN